MDNKFKSVFGEMTEAKKQVIEEARQERGEKLIRKESSLTLCKIPDYRQGGMIEFWINKDGSFETEDSRMDDRCIREQIEKLLRS